MEKESQKFKKIFEYKGLITPMAEKAHRNLKLKTKSNINVDYRLYHFAIGHAFKKSEKEILFDIERNSTNGELIIRRFKELYFDAKNIKDNYFGEIKNLLKKIVENTRNIYAHYIHDFSKVKTSDYEKLLPFIEKAFEVSCIYSYIKEEEISLAEYFEINNKDERLVDFLKEKFYPLNKKDEDLTQVEKDKKDKYLAVRDNFGNKTKNEAIKSLLYINVKESFDWETNGMYKIFRIEAGEYFSHHAHLFLLSMFLYKNEAEKLISKISGFKRNDDNAKKSKRNIFTFFSKKFSSQDIDSEENHLVKFRDIIQYLNKYPIAWNKELEKQNGSVCKNVIEPLEHKILDLEILKAFPKTKDGRNANRNDEHFIIFMKNEMKLGGKKQVQNFTNEEREQYDYEINTNRIIQDAEWKIQEYEKEVELKKKFKERKKLIDTIEECRKKIGKIKEEGKENINDKTDKLKKRVAENSLFMSCGRNQDRFMDFACRFLAETYYFGKKTTFKCYQSYDEEGQNAYLASLTKEEKDAQKYHHGKVVNFFRYEDVVANFPQDYSPFVIENNAIQLKLGGSKYISIQRNLMVYFLEHALYSGEEKENLGLNLLNSYLEEHQTAFSKNLSDLNAKSGISKEEKTEYLKFFPKRLLHEYSEADYSKNEKNKPVENPYASILEQAINADLRYKKLYKEAELKQKELKGRKIDNTVFEDFKKKNKGKQYKLSFIKKAWNLMYFKEIYKKTTSEISHHKTNHISIDEYDDFCKYIFAFGEVSDYKILLVEILKQKNFYTDGIKKIIDKSTDIEDLFRFTLEDFRQWINNKNKEKKIHKIENYLYLKSPEKSITYINASLFIDFLKKQNKLSVENERLQYKSLENNGYLIPEFYYKDKIEIREAKKNNEIRSLFNKLRTSRLEDCLLYEMAIYYLNIEQGIKKYTKKNVTDILSADLEFDINDKNGDFKYKFVLPISKLEAFLEQISFKEEQEQRFNIGYIENIGNHYLENNKNDKALKSIYESFSKTNQLTYDDFNKINAQVMASSCKFSAVYMQLESYFICKAKLSLEEEKNRIDYEKIPDLNTFVCKGDRDRAFHFGLQEEDYQTKLGKIERKFIKEEINKPVAKYSDLSVIQKNVLFSFMKYYDDRNKYVYDDNKLLKEDKIKAIEKEKAENPQPSDEKGKEKWRKNFNKKWGKIEKKIKQGRAEECYLQFINKQK